MKIRDIITEDQEVGEKQTKDLPSSHKAAAPELKTHPGLDNSSPYPGWRFATQYVPGAGTGSYDHEPRADGPIGQKLVTLAYSDADAAIIDQAEKKMGVKSHKLTSSNSTEDIDIHKASPVTDRGPIQRKR
jgi:hypothetical protein